MGSGERVKLGSRVRCGDEDWVVMGPIEDEDLNPANCVVAKVMGDNPLQLKMANTGGVGGGTWIEDLSRTAILAGLANFPNSRKMALPDWLE